jgi:hypothetical protein
LDLPKHYFDALKTTRMIFQAMRPWLMQHATLCHGKFEKIHILLSRKIPSSPLSAAAITDLSPLLTHFDEAAKGHPFFDIATFTLPLSKTKQSTLFSHYLGGRLPTELEKAHFELIDTVLRIVIAARHFLALQTLDNKGRRYFPEELEAMLTPQARLLPSPLATSLTDSPDQIIQQKAVYALGEFFRRTKNPSFHRYMALVAQGN